MLECGMTSISTRVTRFGARSHVSERSMRACGHVQRLLLHPPHEICLRNERRRHEVQETLPPLTFMYISLSICGFVRNSSHERVEKDRVGNLTPLFDGIYCSLWQPACSPVRYNSQLRSTYFDTIIARLQSGSSIALF